MPASTVEPANVQPGTTWARAYGPVPTGWEWSVDVRGCNSGTADDGLYLQLRKTDGSNIGLRANPMLFAKSSDPFDIEKRLTLPAGYELWARSDAGSIAASFTATCIQVAP